MQGKLSSATKPHCSPIRTSEPNAAGRLPTIGGAVLAKTVRSASARELGIILQFGPMTQPVRFSLNGEQRTLPASTSIRGLIEHLGLSGDAVAVERNREIVRRSAWLNTLLREGDRIEIVHFVGGG